MPLSDAADLVLKKTINYIQSAGTFAFEIFKEHDREGDGSLSPQELKYCLNRIGIPGVLLKILAEVIQKAGSNGEGRLEYVNLIEKTLAQAG